VPYGGDPYDVYENPEKARVLGAWGPEIMAGARALHARDLAKEMMGSFQEGGTVPKTGPYKLHKGETIVPAPRLKDKIQRYHMGREPSTGDRNIIRPKWSGPEGPPYTDYERQRIIRYPEKEA